MPLAMEDITPKVRKAWNKAAKAQARYWEALREVEKEIGHELDIDFDLSHAGRSLEDRRYLLETLNETIGADSD